MISACAADLKKNDLKAAVLLYQSSLERKNFVKLKETQLFSYQVNEALRCSTR